MAGKEFKAKLKAIGPKGHWTCMAIPFDVEKEFGSKARVAVKGAINGFAFRSSIFPDGKGKHFMMVNKAMQAGGEVRAGDVARVVLEPDTGPRTVRVTAVLKKALARNKKAKAAFDKLAYSHRKLFVDWINAAKQAETRARRAEKTARMVLAGKTL